MKYFYRDFTHPDFPKNKPQFTRGRFTQWMTDGLGIRRAVFRRQGSFLFIPEYCLTAETRALLPE